MLSKSDYGTNGIINKLKIERQFSYEELGVHSRERTSLEKKQLNYEEHLHYEQYANLCLEGAFYYDIRDKNDKWIRIELEKNGAIVIPAGIYHRLLLHENTHVRLWSFIPRRIKFHSYTRPFGDYTNIRREYLKRIEAIN